MPKYKTVTSLKYVKHGDESFIEISNKSNWINTYIFCNICKEKKHIDDYIIKEDTKKNLKYIKPIKDSSSFICKVCYGLRKLKE